MKDLRGDWQVQEAESRLSELIAKARSIGPQSVIDALLAATALHHDLTIVTRNISDFESTGLRVIDPFS